MIAGMAALVGRQLAYATAVLNTYDAFAAFTQYFPVKNLCKSQDKGICLFDSVLLETAILGCKQHRQARFSYWTPHPIFWPATNANSKWSMDARWTMVDNRLLTLRCLQVVVFLAVRFLPCGALLLCNIFCHFARQASSRILQTFADFLPLYVYILQIRAISTFTSIW